VTSQEQLIQVFQAVEKNTLTLLEQVVEAAQQSYAVWAGIFNTYDASDMST
jgi:hypothetical protein